MPSLPHPVRFQSPVPSILSFRPLSPSPSLSTPKGSIFNNDSDNPFTMISPAFRHLESVESAYKAALSNTHHRCSNNVQPASEHDYYLRQQRPIEVIQLVEVAPPSRKHGSIPCSSSAASSSYASTSSSEDEEESYCSSEDSESDEESTPRRVIPGSFTACMRRIEHWRDTYAKAVGAEFGEWSMLHLLRQPQLTTSCHHAMYPNSTVALAYKAQE